MFIFIYILTIPVKCLGFMKKGNRAYVSCLSVQIFQIQRYRILILTIVLLTNIIVAAVANWLIVGERGGKVGGANIKHPLFLGV